MTVKVTIDFETRSRCDLRKAGMWKYSEDKSTEVLCLAVLVEGLDKESDGVYIWWDKDKHGECDAMPYASQKQIESYLLLADQIEAHNAGFERAIWQNVLRGRNGWINIPVRKWRCSAAKAAFWTLPRDLASAAKIMKADVQKDMEGRMIMLRWCKPRKPTKADPSEWASDPKEFEILMRYCIDDVKAEHSLSAKLPDLDKFELKVWQLTEEMNARGVPIDLGLVRKMQRLLNLQKEKLEARLIEITDGAVKTARQVKVGLRWLADNGLKLDNLRSGTVEEHLDPEGITSMTCEPHVLEYLEIRKALGGAAVKKLVAMEKMACNDGRVRGCTLYCGASRTGRWSGLMLQPQNLMRPKYSQSEIDQFIAFIQDYGDAEDVLEVAELVFGDIQTMVGSCIRACIASQHPDRTLICSDYSAIEGRVLAWLASEMKILQGYIDGLDMYKVAATGIHGVVYDDVTKDQRQDGKVAELALGYQGGYRALMQMAEAYGITLEKKRAKEIVKAWRKQRQLTTALWYETQDAVISAIQNEGEIFHAQRLRFCKKGKWLYMRLPSGRNLKYCNPKIETVMSPLKFEEAIEALVKSGYCKKKDALGVMYEAVSHAMRKEGSPLLVDEGQVTVVYENDWLIVHVEDGETEKHKNVQLNRKDKKVEKPETHITYWGVNSMTRKWSKMTTYGGKLIENATQAIARDIMANGFINAAEYFDAIMLVHDEDAAECNKDKADLELFNQLLTELPRWAEGLPLGADGWVGKRYRK